MEHFAVWDDLCVKYGENCVITLIKCHVSVEWWCSWGVLQWTDGRKIIMRSRNRRDVVVFIVNVRHTRPSSPLRLQDSDTPNDWRAEILFCWCQDACCDQSINTFSKHRRCSAGSWTPGGSIQDAGHKTNMRPLLQPGGNVSALLWADLKRHPAPRLVFQQKTGGEGSSRLGQQRVRQRKDEGAAAERAERVPLEKTGAEVE